MYVFVLWIVQTTHALCRKKLDAQTNLKFPCHTYNPRMGVSKLVMTQKAVSCLHVKSMESHAVPVK